MKGMRTRTRTTPDAARINNALAGEARDKATSTRRQGVRALRVAPPIRAAGFDPYESRIYPKRVGGGRWTTSNQGGQETRDTGAEHAQKQFGSGKTPDGKAKKFPNIKPTKIHITQDPRTGDVIKGPKVITAVETDPKTGVKIMHLRDMKTGKTSRRFVAQGVQVIGKHA